MNGSLRRRLLLSTTSIAGAGVLVLGIPMGVLIDRVATESALAHTQHRAELINIALADDLLAGQVVDGSKLRLLDPPGHELRYTGPTGEVVDAGRTLTGATLTARLEGPTGSTLELVADAGPLRRSIERWILGLVALSVAGVAAAAILALAQARRLGGPLQALAASAQRIGDGDFSASAGTTGLRELDAIARSIDAGSARVGRLLRAERAFSSQASHQLRSPLTALVLRLDSLAVSDDAMVREEATAALEQADRLDRTIEDLLRLARTGRAGERTSFDLAELVRLHAGDADRRARRLGRHVEVSAGAAGAFATPGAIGQIVDVLLDNALVHGRGSTRVSVTSDAERGTVEVTVTDEGIGLDAERIIDLFGVRPDGHGIGLALARTLAHADGGRLELVSSRPPVFRLRLPADDQHSTEPQLP